MKFPVWFVTALDVVHRRVYRMTGGRIGGQLWVFPMLLLQTVGRKSGIIRTHALLYVRDGKNMIICASNNGQPQYPGWYWNLLANPQAKVQAGRQHYLVFAELATGDEYERLWRKLLAVYPPYA